MAGLTATLRVERAAAPWRDRLRPYRIVVDGETVGSVADGTTEEVSVAPGRHTLRLRIDWASSPEVEFVVADGEQVTLRCRPNGGARSAWRGVFSPHRYIAVSAP
jgi:hypothetical protein